jgi:hypothetical protein
MKVRASAFVVGVAVAALVWTRVASATPLPSRIAGIGDSITRATDVCSWYGDHPGHALSGHTRRLR